MMINTATINEPTRLHALIDSFDCISEYDFCLLADATSNTVEAWRKRGIGPAYILIGKRYLYPRKAVAEYLESKLRTFPRVTSAI